MAAGFSSVTAFSDGTWIPLLVAYITLAHVDAHGMLLGFGIAMIATGLFYRTPFLVQPMKAIGAVATTNAAHGIVPGLWSSFTLDAVGGHRDARFHRAHIPSIQLEN